jgi:integrase
MEARCPKVQRNQLGRSFRGAQAENRHLDVVRIPNISFFKLCDQYWEMRGKQLRTKGLRTILRIWKREFGNLNVKELARPKIEKMLKDRMERDGISASTRNRHLAMIKSMFQCTIKWGLMRENPASGIPKLRETGARNRFLDLEEVRMLLEGASESFRPILITALHTGMRRGELLNLRWSDVDFGNRIIMVRETKSGRQRAIPIDQTLYRTLSELPSRFKKGFVFPSPIWPDRPMSDLTHSFRRLVRKVGLANLRLHDIRHTFASHLVMNGVDIRTVQELLGHTTLTMTMRYSHLAPVHRTRALQILDSVLATDTKTDTVANEAPSGSL